LDLPDETFDYDEAIRNEGLKTRRRPRGVSVFWWFVGTGLLLAILLLVARSMF
jgi:hypothetical protein